MVASLFGIPKSTSYSEPVYFSSGYFRYAIVYLNILLWMDVWIVTNFLVTKTKVQRKQVNTDLRPCEYFYGTQYCKRDGGVKAYLHLMLS